MSAQDPASHIERDLHLAVPCGTLFLWLYVSVYSFPMRRPECESRRQNQISAQDPASHIERDLHLAVPFGTFFKMCLCIPFRFVCLRIPFRFVDQNANQGDKIR